MPPHLLLVAMAKSDHPAHSNLSAPTEDANRLYLLFFLAPLRHFLRAPVRASIQLGAEEADVEVDPGLLLGRRRLGRRRHVRLAARAPGVAPGDEHVQEAPRARRGHHPAAGGRGVAAVALLHGAAAVAAALDGGRGHGRGRRGGSGAAVLLMMMPLPLLAALEPLQRRLHLLDRAHAVVRRGGGRRGCCCCRCRRRRRRYGRAGDGE